jgi:hypothetical protein
MKTSIFAFATDLHDEGVDTVVQNVADRGGAGGVTVASAYHHGRDIFPHNPARKVHFLEGGAVFFRPDSARYDGRIQPHVSRLAEEADVFTALREMTEQRGMQVHAWTVFLHNSTLAGRHPDCAVRNVFGDAYVTDLCPANPEVRRYAVTLAGDLMRYRVDTVLAESLHYHPLEHGFHHERYFIELGALGRFLLGLCFCDHCMRRADERGVNARAVRDAARSAVEAAFEADPDDAGEELDRKVIQDFAGGEMAGYLAMRADAVTTLAEDIAEAVDGGGGQLTFMDLSGAVKGYATGRPTGEAAPTIAWRLGVDLEGLARACHGVEAIGYAAEVDRLRFDLGAYRDLVGEEAALSVALRPMAPDCDSAENLAAKLALCRELELERADFYHYGFMRLGTLDRIAEALAATPG